MKTDSDGCHVDYLYDNQHWWLPCGLFLTRNVLYHFSLSKVIPQNTKLNIEYLLCDLFINRLSHPLFKISLRHCHALMVENGAFSHKIDWRASKLHYWFKSTVVYWMGGFWLLVELHQKGSAHSLARRLVFFFNIFFLSATKTLLNYVGILNIWKGFHGESTLKINQKVPF